MKKYKNCQSCGMPLSKDKNGGQKSSIYCSHCFANGEFTLPGITVNEMKQRVESKIVEFGFPRFLAGFFTRNIPELERWKQNS